MTFQSHFAVQDHKLLKVVVQVQRWESLQQSIFQTRSGRELYFRVAETLLVDRARSQHLKWLNGAMTGRATRDRLKEFENSGWLAIERMGSDLRTKQIAPTEKFTNQLNLHLQILRLAINEDFLLIDKG